MIEVNGDKPVKVALLGCGNVGSQVARLLLETPDDLAARVGAPVELTGIGVRHPDAERKGIDPALFTKDSEALVRSGVDVVIEVIGGIEPAKSLLLAAFESGASVVTANKALLAAHGQELYSAAERAGVDLYFEAAVAGAIPIIRPLRESLVGDEITTAPAEEKPSIRLPGGSTVVDTTEDIEAARAQGYVIKLLAVATLCGEQEEEVSVRVHPTMVPASHPLASVRGAYNAIFIESRNAGSLMFLGPGAGGSPTASAVMGDLVTIARNRIRGTHGPAMSTYRRYGIASIEDAMTSYYLTMQVKDEPGVLAKVASVFAKHEVSILGVRQTTDEDGHARLGIMTHLARDAEFTDTVSELRTMTSSVSGRIRLIRVEGR